MRSSYIESAIEFSILIGIFFSQQFGWVGAGGPLRRDLPAPTSVSYISIDT